MKIVLITLLLTLSGQVFAQDKVDYINVTIEPYKSLSYGAFVKRLTLTGSNRGAEYIAGFDFEWGYAYELKLKRTKLANPPMDVGDTNYELSKVISKTAVADSTTFTVRLEGNRYLGGGDNKGLLSFPTETTCIYGEDMNFRADPKFMNELKGINLTEKSRVGQFMFLNGEIVLLGLK